MKNTIAILLGLSLLTANTALGDGRNTVHQIIIDGVSIETPVSADPLMVRIDNTVQVTGQLHLRQGEVLRGIISHRTQDPDGIFTYYNSKGEVRGFSEMSDRAALAIKEKLRAASKSCPMDLVINRNTLAIERLISTCDDLAAIEAQKNEG